MKSAAPSRNLLTLRILLTTGSKSGLTKPTGAAMMMISISVSDQPRATRRSRMRTAAPGFSIMQDLVVRGLTP